MVVLVLAESAASVMAPVQHLRRLGGASYHNRRVWVLLCVIGHRVIDFVVMIKARCYRITAVRIIVPEVVPVEASGWRQQQQGKEN